MPSLSDQLKALGVKIGTREVPPPAPPVAAAQPLERLIPGRILETAGGPAYVVEKIYPLVYRQEAPSTGLLSEAGRPWELHLSAPLDAVAAWAGQPRVAQADLRTFAFLDIETTGLAGGTGTYAFLVGVGRYIGEEYHLAQFFLRDPSEEPAQLLALESFLAPCEVLVTFNGKSFDAPLLNTRYLAQGWRSPVPDLAPLDLLHLARRLWRDRLPSRTLGTLEEQILGARRSGEDIPGWMVPQMYFDYLHTGDATPLLGVFYHNAMDVLSMAALLNHMAHLLDDPLHAQGVHDLDWPALGRLFDDLGRGDTAIELYRLALEGDLPPEHRADTQKRLAQLHKRRGELEHAMALWQTAAEARQVYACIELAKTCEHERRDPGEALRWTEQALLCLEVLPRYERLAWEEDLERRKGRLLRKLAGASPRA